MNVDSAIELTTSTGSQAGRVYYSTAENVTACGQFTVNFDFRITPPATGSVADGIAFWFLSSPVGAASTGSALDIPPNPIGLVLVMDTYDNDGDGLNPEITMYGYNGTIPSYTEGSATQRLTPIYGHENFVDNGAWHHCLLTYNGGAIKVYYDYSATALMTATYPITTAGQFGFSASTGGAWSKQEVKNVYIRANSVSPILGNAAICKGSTTTLSDSTSGGTWSSSNATVASVASTGVVTGASAGTATITYTYSTCFSTIVVTVNPLPVAITGTTNVCVGLTTTLTDATGGGTWTSSTGGVATVGSSTGVVTGMAGGTSNITFIITSTGCYTVTPVTVNPLPAAITGTMNVCVGLTTALTDATSGGTWSSTGTATVGTTGIVTGGSAGTATITYTLATGCIQTAIVTVNALPTAINGTLTVCSGLTTTLTDGSAGGTWSSSATGIATVGLSTGIVTGGVVATTSTATITYTLGTGCIITAVVTVNPLPTAILGNLSVCSGLTTTLSDAGGGTWSSGATGVATVGSTTGIVTGGTVATAGTATITYTLPTGCITTAIVTVNPLPTAILGNLSVCSGLTTTLSDAGGGTWSSSATGIATVGLSTGIVTGGVVATTSTATITYTLGTGCIITADVTVNPLPTAILGNLTVCSGLTTTLSDAGGGTWSSSATGIASVGSTTGIVTGGTVLTTSTATITYTIGTGCIITADVTVNPLPTAILGNMNVCLGLTTSLSDATAGGTWSSTGTATVSATGMVTGVSVGSGTITYTLTATGCIITTVVTVNPLPTAILGTLSVCSGLTTTLSDAGGGTWSSSATGIATVGLTTGVVTGGVVATTSTATITYTLPTTCIITADVTVNPLPTAILGALSVCSGLTTTLSDAGGGTWSSSATGIATVGLTTGVVTGGVVATTSTATITYTLPTTCIITAVVTVNPLPANITGTLQVCSGLTTTLSDVTALGTWSSSTTTVAIVGSTTGIVTGEVVAVTSTATITYTLPTGCIATAVVTVNPLPTAILGSLSVCTGLTTSLTDATGGGTSSSSTGTIGTISTTGVVTGISNGTTTITYKLPTGCIITAIVTVNPLPVLITGTKTVCSGLTTNLFDGTGGGTWTSSNTGVATVGSTTGVVTGQVVAVTSTATITYTIGTGCVTTTTVTVNPLPTAILGANTVCLGSTITLSDAGGGTWTSSNGNATIGLNTGVVTGSNVGTSRITYTLPTGCIITTIVTVNPLPVAITGPTLVCVGSTITLSDGTGGGTWSSSNTGIGSIGLTTGVVSGISGGAITISYILGTGCYATYTVTVDAQLAVITPIGDTTFCLGGFVALTANTGAGLTYQWYIGGVAISGAALSSYIASIAGSYQVMVTNSAGCSTLSTPMSVTIDTAVAVITSTGATTICSGTSATLDANLGAGFSYQWLLGGAVITGAVGSSYTTTAGGDYSVIVTNATGCSATSNVITISINPSPTANIVLSGPLTFCQNDSVVMTTDFAPDYTYQWYNAAGAILGATGQSYTATTAGTYSVTVTNSYGCTATSVVMTVVVNPLPDVTITAGGPTLFCAGGSVTLSATAVGGDTYQWYMGGTAIAGATNSSYLVTVGGGYQVQVTDPATGCTAMTLADTMVTVVATPVIIPITPASFCWGGSALLSTSVSGATGTILYQWYLNGVLIPGATGPTYNTTTPGNYSCQITIPGSCTVTTLAAPVTEYPLPNPIVTFDGTYFRTGSYYVTYQWYMNLVAITGATDSFTVALGSGDYKVAVTDTNGCQSYSDVYVYTGGATTAIQNINKNEIKIYPNPAQTMVHIESAQQVRAVISGIDGRSILNIPGAKDIDISSLPDGVYMIMLYDDNGNMMKTVKLVKAAN